jgi:hypothetical protein
MDACLRRNDEYLLGLMTGWTSGTRQVRRRALLGLAAGGVALFRLSPVAAKPFTDAAGREFDLPDRVESACLRPGRRPR